jgi:patatin-like phospholipase/acyl hydrolase
VISGGREGDAVADGIGDGGGIRGLSELIIIEDLMERIKWKEGLDEAPIPADRFDLIGGTSTGR